MRIRFIAAAFAALLTVTPALAQNAGPAKPQTNCTPSASSAGTSSPNAQTTGSTPNSQAVEKSAILPSAGGHAQSAAPTVQSNGEPMEVRPDCPPEQTKPK